MIRLFPSFSRLINMINGGFELNDDSNTYYFFGCSKEGIDQTFEMYDRKNKCDRRGLLSILNNAENEGRCCWNSYNQENPIRFLMKIGFTENRFDLGHHNLPEIDIMLYRNLPNMADMIQTNHPEIQFMWD